ncbi:MAG: SWIM zinc finger family protein [Eubacteriales bacterium]
MYKDKISDESFISMAAQAADCMDPELYEKGREFSRRVTWAKSYGQRIYSAVSDGKIHTVILHIDDFAKSTCTCGKKPLCEHIAAVFFHYYDPWLQLNGIQPKKNFKPDKTPPKKFKRPAGEPGFRSRRGRPG